MAWFVLKKEDNALFSFLQFSVERTKRTVIMALPVARYRAYNSVSANFDLNENE